MKYLKIYTDFLQDMEELTDAEKGRLFCMMLEYAETGSSSLPQGNEKYIWGTARKMIDAQRDSYEKICERNRTNGVKHVSQTIPNDPKVSQWVEEQEQEQEQKQEHKRNVFVKPTLEEIEAYCKERNNQVDAQTFFDFYESKNWMIGKNKMKDFKAAIRNWERREKPKAKYNRVVNGYQQHKDIGDITHLYVDM